MVYEFGLSNKRIKQIFFVIKLRDYPVDTTRIADMIVAGFSDHVVAITITAAIGEWFFLKFTVLGDYEKRIRGLEEKNHVSHHVINTIPPPETKTWITYGEVWHMIRRSSLMLKAVEKWDRPPDYHSVLATIEREANRARYGQSDQDRYEEKHMDEVFRYYLGRILSDYPQAKNDEGKYSKDIIEHALLKMAADK